MIQKPLDTETTRPEPDFRPVPAVTNAVRLLEALASNGDALSLTETAKNADVPVATALKILRTLERDGLVYRHPENKSYQLGNGILRLARAVPDQDRLAHLRHQMSDIATRFDCLTVLWQVTPTRVILRERALAKRPLRLDMEVTQRMPVYVGAVGRAVAAARNVPTTDLEQVFNALRWENPMSFAEYCAQIDDAARNGYAVDADNLYKGVHAIAAVVTDRTGAPTAAISAIALSGSLDKSYIETVGQALKHACQTTAP